MKYLLTLFLLFGLSFSQTYYDVPGTHANVQAAIDAIPNDLSGTGVHVVRIDSGTYSECPDAATGFTNPSPTDYIHIRAADGHEHKGVFGNGVVITGNCNPLFRATLSYIQISGIEILDGGATVKNLILTNAAGVMEVRLDRMLLKSISASNGFNIVNTKVYNSVIISTFNSNPNGVSGVNAPGPSSTNGVQIFNSVCDSDADNDGAKGFSFCFQNGRFTNTAGFSANNSVFSGTDQSDYNISDDASAPGSNSLINQTFASMNFISRGTDYHIDSLSIAFDAGVPVDDNVIDIDSLCWNTWSIGVDDPIANGITECVFCNVSSPKRYTTRQRDGSDQADIPASGTYGGTPDSIQCRFNAGPWSTVDASPTGLTWSGNLLNQNAGQGMIECRTKPDTSVTCFTLDISIGDVFYVWGSTNIQGQGGTNHPIISGSVKNTKYSWMGMWEQLEDPTANAHGSGTPGGSPWTFFADAVRTKTGFPVAILNFGQGHNTTNSNSSVAKPTSDWKVGSSAFDDAISAFSTANTGGLKAYIVQVGENENILDRETFGPDYADSLCRIDSLIQSVDGTNITAPLVANLVGHRAHKALLNDSTAMDSIRIGIIESWNKCALIGAVTQDLDLAADGGDSIRFGTGTDQTKIKKLGWRTARAVINHFFNGPDGNPPDISTATFENNSLDINFNSNAGSLQSTGVIPVSAFRVNDGTGFILPDTAVLSGNVIELTFSRDLVTPIILDFQPKNYGLGINVYDSPALGTDYASPPIPEYQLTVSAFVPPEAGNPFSASRTRFFRRIGIR